MAAVSYKPEMTNEFRQLVEWPLTIAIQIAQDAEKLFVAYYELQLSVSNSHDPAMFSIHIRIPHETGFWGVATLVIYPSGEVLLKTNWDSPAEWDVKYLTGDFVVWLHDPKALSKLSERLSRAIERALKGHIWPSSSLNSTKRS